MLHERLGLEPIRIYANRYLYLFRRKLTANYLHAYNKFHRYLCRARLKTTYLGLTSLPLQKQKLTPEFTQYKKAYITFMRFVQRLEILKFIFCYEFFDVKLLKSRSIERPDVIKVIVSDDRNAYFYFILVHDYNRVPAYALTYYLIGYLACNFHIW
jgi:hypothetical protein